MTHNRVKKWQCVFYPNYKLQNTAYVNICQYHGTVLHEINQRKSQDLFNRDPAQQLSKNPPASFRTELHPVRGIARNVGKAVW